MAILKDFEVAVVVNRQPLNEYRPGGIEPTASSILSYVEAITGNKFSVRFKVPHDYATRLGCSGFTLYLYIDGECVRKYPAFENGSLDYRRYYKDGKRFAQDLIFDKIKIGLCDEVIATSADPMQMKTPRPRKRPSMP